MPIFESWVEGLEMKTYAVVLTSIWADEKFLSLAKDQKLVFLTFLTHPMTTSLGTMYMVSSECLAKSVGMSTGLFKKTCGHLVDIDMLATYSGWAELFWLPNFMKDNPPDNPNVVISWTKILSTLPQNGLKARIIRECLNVCKSRGSNFYNVIPEDIHQELEKLKKLETHQQTLPGTVPKQYAKSGFRNQDSENSINTCPGFEPFWQDYPKKEKKERARKAWKQVKPPYESEDFQAVYAAYRERWRDTERKYIPLAASWLRDRSWEDEILSVAESSAAKRARIKKMVGKA